MGEQPADNRQYRYRNGTTGTDNVPDREHHNDTGQPSKQYKAIYFDQIYGHPALAHMLPL